MPPLLLERCGAQFWEVDGCHCSGRRRERGACTVLPPWLVCLGQALDGHSSPPPGLVFPWQVFDGHNGTAAAIHARDKLMSYVLEQIPKSVDTDGFVDALPAALAEGFLKCHNSFAMSTLTPLLSHPPPSALCPQPSASLKRHVAISHAESVLACLLFLLTT